ncbi:hypothetical protein FGG08_005063 [Glutinoglossum americanum]|uniref:Uncharacterized protein n=1 Tax=Glutinoglossum americanum TaxID=1670608 RepID=A0A9P8I666_9PEZI|nr:hypothetical protein FGG08_005063 [Glutinoglossum americanum]
MTSTTTTANAGLRTPSVSSSEGEPWGNRPEIEEKARFEEIFMEGGRRGKFEEKSCVGYFEVGGLGGNDWWVVLEKELDDEGLMKYLERGESGGTTEGMRVRVFFLKRPSNVPYLQKQLRITSSMMKYLCSRFRISKAFIESLFDSQIWCGNACFTQRDGNGRVVEFGL